MAQAKGTMDGTCWPGGRPRRSGHTSPAGPPLRSDPDQNQAGWTYCMCGVVACVFIVSLDGLRFIMVCK